jgi:protein-tyrosine phosphatase
VTGALRDIATADGAAIVHCAAGKDRTGVIVAMALTVAGVEPDAIVADYVATADRIEAIIERLRRSRTYAADMSARPVAAHLPRADTMRAFLEQLDVRYGGLPRWLAGNGFAEHEYGLLRAKLRQP